MSADASNKICRWLRPLVFPADITTAERPDRLTVAHVNVNDKTAPVKDVPCIIGDEVALGDISADLFQAMQDDANGLGTVQRYVVGAWKGEKLMARLVLRVKQEEDPADDVAVSEGGSVRGQLAQTQRHLEAVMRIGTSGQAATMTIMERVMARMEERDSRMADKHLELLVLVEDLHQHKHEREIEVLEKTSKIDMRNRFASGAAPLLGALSQKLLGKTPEGNQTPESVMFKGFLRALTPEQIEGMRLTPDQLIVLGALVDAEEEKDARTERRPNGH